MKTCSIDGCDTPALARGWCNKHYKRWAAHGDPLTTKWYRPIPSCSVESCEKPAHAHGLCSLHNWRRNEYGDPLAPVKEHRPQGLSYREAADWYLARAVRDDAGCLVLPEHIGQKRPRYSKTISLRGRMMQLYRLVLIGYAGEPDEKMDASHTCHRGRSGCITPEHLVWESHADNLRRDETLPIAAAAPPDRSRAYPRSGR